MHTTHVNLNSEQLQQCLAGFHATFTEYIGILGWLLAYEGCRDGDGYTQSWIHPPMPDVLRAMKDFSLRVDEGRFVDLSNIGIDIRTLFEANRILMFYPFDSTKYSFGPAIGMPCFLATKREKERDAEKMEFMKRLARTEKGSYDGTVIVDVTKIKTDIIGRPRIIPSGYQLESYIIIKSETYSFWEYWFRRFVEFWLAPLDAIMEHPIELPYDTPGGIFIPRNNPVKLNQHRDINKRFKSLEGRKPLPEIPKAHLLTCKKAFAILSEYQNETKRLLMPIHREINRLLINENIGKNQQIDMPRSQDAPSLHPSGFKNPSVQTKIGDAAKALGFGSGESATKKLRNHMKNNPGFAISVPERASYYWFNRDYPGSSILPSDNERMQHHMKK